MTNYDNITEYLAVDISPDQIENAQSLICSAKLPNKVRLNFLVSDIPSLKLDKQYDLVILSEVFSHILSTEINSIIKKLLTLSNKHIINIDCYADHPPRIQARYNFIHQYEAIYKKYTEPFIIIKRIPINRKNCLGPIIQTNLFFILL